MAKKSYTLCDHKCPVHQNCARYLDDMDKTKTNHFAWMPYDKKEKKCGFFVLLTEEEIIDRMLNLLKPFDN
jgi:hypothetical protein